MKIKILALAAFYADGKYDLVGFSDASPEELEQIVRQLAEDAGQSIIAWRMFRHEVELPELVKTE